MIDTNCSAAYVLSFTGIHLSRRYTRSCSTHFFTGSNCKGEKDFFPRKWCSEGQVGSGFFESVFNEQDNSPALLPRLNAGKWSTAIQDCSRLIGSFRRELSALSLAIRNGYRDYCLEPGPCFFQLSLLAGYFIPRPSSILSEKGNREKRHLVF